MGIHLFLVLFFIGFTSPVYAQAHKQKQTKSKQKDIHFVW